MEFCPRCGGLMLPQKIKDKTSLVCQACGFTQEPPGEYILTWPGKKPKEPEVIESTPQTLPTANVACPSCGHGKAYWWIRQTRGGDEPSTRFYRCTRCGKVWREYA